MRYKQEKTITINKKYPIDTFIETISNIKFNLKFEAENSKKIDENAYLNKIKQQKSIAKIPTLMLITVFLLVGVLLFMDSMTNNLVILFSPMTITIVILMSIVHLLEKIDENKKTQIRNERESIKQKILHMLDSDPKNTLIPILQLNLDTIKNDIKTKNIIDAHSELEYMLNLIREIKLYYGAKNVLSVNPSETQKLLNKPIGDMIHLLFEDQNDKICLITISYGQRNYYEFNETSKEFELIKSPINFTEEENDDLQRNETIIRNKQAFYNLIDEGLAITTNHENQCVEVWIDEDQFTTLEPVLEIEGGFKHMLETDFNIKYANIHIISNQSKELLAAVLLNHPIMKKY